MANAGGDDQVAWRSEPAPWGKADALAVAVWTAAILVYFWDAVAFRGALFYFDITEINFPYRDFLAREMRLGRFSRWFPGLYCGMPLYSESQAGYLHPLKFFLYPWLECWKAFNLDTVLSVWLTGLGTYGWLRRHVGPRGALTGAGVFGLSGFVWAHLIHTSMNNALTSVPFAVWALEWAWQCRSRLGVVAGALALAFQVFAGHLQDTILTAGLLALYGLYRAATERDRAARRWVLGRTAGLMGLGVALAAVQWVPSKELLDRSPRSGGLTWRALTYGSWHPELLPTLVVREAYGTRARDTDWMDGFYPYHEMNAYLGLTALALAVVGAAAYRDRWVAFWVGLALFGSLLMLGRFTFLMDVAHRVPVVGSSRIPVRFHLWVSLAVAALAAVGVDRLGASGERVRLRLAFGLVGFLVVASVPILLYVYAPALTDAGRWRLPYHLARFRWLSSELQTAALRTFVLTAAGLAATAAAARARSPRVRGLATGVLPMVVIADLLGAHWWDVPTVDPAYWTRPPVTAVRLKADPTLTRVFGLADRSAGEPGYASEPVEFFSVRDALDWSLGPVWGVPSSSGVTPIIPRRHLAYTDHAKAGAGRFVIESVSHVLTGRKTRTIFGEGEEVGSARIHAVEGARPRARLAGSPYYARDEQGAVEALDRLRGAILERLVVEDPDRPLDEAAAVSGTATITRDDPEHVEVTTDSPGPAYLVLADTYDPGWSATLDGHPAPIRPAWVTFRAVFLPAGRHTVVFRYRPAGFLAGLALSLAGAAAALAALTLGTRKALPPLGDEHRTLAVSRRVRAGVAAGLLVVLVGSVVGFDAYGRPTAQGRWFDSFHQFTWGAGIEAMHRPPNQ